MSAAGVMITASTMMVISSPGVSLMVGPMKLLKKPIISPRIQKVIAKIPIVITIVFMVVLETDFSRRSCLRSNKLILFPTHDEDLVV